MSLLLLFQSSAAAGDITGSTSLTFTPAGILTGAGALIGASSLTFSTSAALAGAAALTGTSTLTFSTSAALAGDGALSGTSTLTFTTQGDLTGTGSAEADTKRGGDDAPAVYDEEIERKRRKKKKQRERSLEDAIQQAWNAANGIEPEAAPTLAPVPIKELPKRAKDLAAQLETKTVSPDRQRQIKQLIARLKREAEAVEQMAEQARIEAELEEEAIVMLLAA
jgi:hypothetical protein